MASEPHTLQPRVTARYRYRWHSAAFLSAMLVLAMVALIAVIASSRASSTPLLDESTMSAARELATTQKPAQIALAGVTDMQLMLPIFEREVTAIGYHPVDGDNLMSLSPNGHQINGSLISSLGSQSAAGGPGYYIMEEGGKSGSPTASIDVGAPAGTIVYSPVDGTIAGIRSYKLNGKCPDTELKILPNNHSNMVVVITHLNNIQSTLGQPVRAGDSRLGAVRQLDGCIEQQLSRYTYDTGNHVSMQVEYISKKSNP
ncbi:MAG: M23 family metallopeptidase [Actinobacteria bacterium]|nr:M23 family metallopeptidase [Actinomycetota bacterium]